MLKHGGQSGVQHDVILILGVISSLALYSLPAFADTPARPSPYPGVYCEYFYETKVKTVTSGGQNCSQQQKRECYTPYSVSPFDDCWGSWYNVGAPYDCKNPGC